MKIIDTNKKLITVYRPFSIQIVIHTGLIELKCYDESRGGEGPGSVV